MLPAPYWFSCLKGDFPGHDSQSLGATRTLLSPTGKGSQRGRGSYLNPESNLGVEPRSLFRSAPRNVTKKICIMFSYPFQSLTQGVSITEQRLYLGLKSCEGGGLSETDGGSQLFQCPTTWHTSLFLCLAKHCCTSVPPSYVWPCYFMALAF